MGIVAGNDGLPRRVLSHLCLGLLGLWRIGTKRDTYAVQDFVGLVNQFMEQLGIARAPLVGHSMGGTVSLAVAIKYPERVSKVVIIGSPIVGSSLFFFPKVFGYRAFGWLTYHNIWVYKSFYHLLASAYSKDRNWAAMMDRDVSRTTMQAFFASIGSLRKTDLRPSLDQIHVPVLGMFGDKDIVVDPKSMEAFASRCAAGRAWNVSTTRAISLCWMSPPNSARSSRLFWTSRIRSI